MYLRCIGSCCRKVCCVWKSSLPCPPPQDACCLFTSLSAVTQYPASQGKVCQLMSHLKACDHYSLIILLGGIFFVCLAQQRWPWTAGLWKELFACFLVAWFGTTLPPVYHTARTENERAIIITFCHKLLSLALLFSKSGYTYVGSAARSIHIYRK